MRAREYRLLEEAVDAGVAIGWNRAHKHGDTPSAEHVQESVRREVLNEILERFALEPDADAVQ